MAATKTRKKYYTVEQANATLPLLRLIVRDITILAQSLNEQHRRLTKLQERPSRFLKRSWTPPSPGWKRAGGRCAYEQELRELNLELKDYSPAWSISPRTGRPGGLPVLAAGRAGGRPLARAGRRFRGPAEAGREVANR